MTMNAGLSSVRSWMVRQIRKSARAPADPRPTTDSSSAICSILKPYSFTRIGRYVCRMVSSGVSTSHLPRTWDQIRPLASSRLTANCTGAAAAAEAFAAEPDGDFAGAARRPFGAGGCCFDCVFAEFFAMHAPQCRSGCRWLPGRDERRGRGHRVRCGRRQGSGGGHRIGFGCWEGLRARRHRTPIAPGGGCHP